MLQVSIINYNYILYLEKQQLHYKRMLLHNIYLKLFYYSDYINNKISKYALYCNVLHIDIILYTYISYIS